MFSEGLTSSDLTDLGNRLKDSAKTTSARPQAEACLPNNPRQRYALMPAAP